VYYYNGAQRYEQFLQVGRLYRALILLGLALYYWSTSISLIFIVLCTMYIVIFFVTSFSSPYSELSLVGLVHDLVD